MKNIYFITAFIIGFLLLSKGAQAGGPSEWMKIIQIYSYADGVTRVIVSSPHSDPDGCGNPYTLHISSTADKKVYTTVLTAFTTGKQINVYMSGCLWESGNNAALVTRVALQ